MTRIRDILISLIVLTVLMPALLIVLSIVYLQDGSSPFYIAARTGKAGRQFKMIKIRSMIKNADKSGVDSTSADDKRITKVGKFIRKSKLDEVVQLINVLIGDMSLVGPRPNVKRETDLYTTSESELLRARPGITDYASIVFSDEGDILRGSKDPDIDYHQLIRPGKSRLGLFYLRTRNQADDMLILFLTLANSINRNWTLNKLSEHLKNRGASDDLVLLVLRNTPLIPTAPPGAQAIVRSRDGVCKD